MLAVLCIFFLFYLHSVDAIGFCESFKKCNKCLGNSSLGKCSWVYVDRNETWRCLNSTINYNSSEIITNSSFCHMPCNINDTFLGMSQNGFCRPLDYLVSTACIFCWVLATVFFLFIVTVYVYFIIFVYYSFF